MPTKLGATWVVKIPASAARWASVEGLPLLLMGYYLLRHVKRGRYGYSQGVGLSEPLISPFPQLLPKK